ncbi:CLUMA_CG017241, isoform A [Clunio marinus]|uniref:CLUMA_CG017241, isoform A n=1 Tax=Clunio marinus TaxID=568069 RepID=A0A1J1IVK1_9DIPT|nr:CLUMA_CG017241, isoform A [Clunio marinus]
MTKQSNSHFQLKYEIFTEDDFKTSAYPNFNVEFTLPKTLILLLWVFGMLKIVRDVRLSSVDIYHFINF